MSITHTIRVLETMAEDMKDVVQGTNINLSYRGFCFCPALLRKGFYRLWEHDEWKLMQNFGINEFNALDVRMPR